MNKLYNLVLFFVVSHTLSAQTPDMAVSHISVTDYSLYNIPKLELAGELGLVTSFLNNTLVFNDFWSDDVIQTQINALSKTNRLGGFVSGSATYYTGKSNGLNVGLRHKSITALCSQKAFVELILKGNSAQSLMSIDQANNFESQKYSNLSIGLEQFDDVTRKKVGVGLGILLGHKYARVDGSSGQFVTDSSGEKISVTGADIAVRQDLSGFFEGYGAALRFEMKQKRPNGDLWSFQIMDLGFIRSSQVRTATLINNFTFDGFDVSSQINSAGDINIQDSVNRNYFTIDTSAGVRMSPFETSIEFVRDLNNSNFLDTRISYLYFAGYYPLLESNYQQSFGLGEASWRVGARLGGFGAYGLNFGAVLPIQSKHILRIDLTGLESMVASNLPVYWYGKIGLTIWL